MSSFCPICQLPLVGCERADTIHVNACIDGLGKPGTPSSVKAPTPSKSKQTLDLLLANLNKESEPLESRSESMSLLEPKLSHSDKPPLLKLTTKVISKAIKSESPANSVLDLSSVSSSPPLKRNYNNSTGRSCPYYKKIPGTRIRVDAFSYQVEPDVGIVFFLSCPGAVLMLFEVKDAIRPGHSKKYLHCGDFRAHVDMRWQYPKVFLQTLNIVFLDTTYLRPEYSFPSQEEVIQAVEEIVQTEVIDFIPPKKHLTLDNWVTGTSKSNSTSLSDEKNTQETTHSRGNELQQSSLRKWLTPSSLNDKVIMDSLEKDAGLFNDASWRRSRTLVVVGTYTIGKERIIHAISRRLGCQIYSSSRKRKILSSLQNEDLSSRLCDSPSDTCLHTVSMGEMNLKSLSKYLEQYRDMFHRIIGFKPTGWTFKNSKSNQTKLKERKSLSIPEWICLTRNEKQGVTIYEVPYSEHSSFAELEWFITSLRIQEKVVPTVYGGLPLEEMKHILEQWRKKGLKG